MRLLRAQTKQTIHFLPFPFVPMKNAEQHLPKPTQHTIRLAHARSLGETKDNTGCSAPSFLLVKSPKKKNSFSIFHFF